MSKGDGGGDGGGHRGAVTAMHFSAAGPWAGDRLGILFTGGSDRTVKVWPVSTEEGRSGEEEGSPMQTLCGHGHTVEAVVASEEEGVLFTAGLDGTLRVW